MIKTRQIHVASNDFHISMHIRVLLKLCSLYFIFGELAESLWKHILDLTTS